MFNLIKADHYRMFKMQAVRLCMLVSIISALIMGVVLHGVYKGTITLDTSSAFALVSDTMLIMVLGAILVGVLVCGSFDTKNIHDEIACGNGRLTIVISKMITISFFVILLTLPYTFMTVIGFASKVGFGVYVGVPSSYFNILSNVPGVPVNKEYILKAIVLSMIITLTYIAKMSICIPIAFKVRKSIPVIIVGFVSTFFFDIIAALTKGKEGVAGFVHYLPFTLVYELTLDCSVNLMVKSVICSILFMSAMLLDTYFSFRKSEIK